MTGVRLLAAAFAGSILLPPTAFAQSSPGQITRAKEGDTVVVEGAGKVKLVRRRNADVRVIHHPVERWVVVLADHSQAAGQPGDGRVDVTYTFHDISEWPLGERWTGPATVDDYTLAGDMGVFGLGLSTSAGFVQLLAPNDQHGFKDPAALTLYYRGSSRGIGGNQPMDAVEAQQVAEAQRNVQARANMPERLRGMQNGVQMSVTGGVSSASGGIVITPGTGSDRGPSAPIRVGGNIRTPAKLHTVEPVLPESAAKAGIFGMVILEIIIGTDGSVSEAKVLRSIPLLDKAAIDAVRQWRYEPTHLNGQPVPVIMTVTVNFR